jgi:uncharacterized protein YqeY
LPALRRHAKALVMSHDLAPALTARIRADLKTAMQARVSAEAAALRALIGAIDNAQAVPLDPDHKPAAMRPFGAAAEAPRIALDADALRAIIVREMDEREAAACEFIRLDRADRAAMLRAEAALIGRYLS